MPPNNRATPKKTLSNHKIGGFGEPFSHPNKTKNYHPNVMSPVRLLCPARLFCPVRVLNNRAGTIIMSVGVLSNGAVASRRVFFLPSRVRARRGF